MLALEVLGSLWVLPIRRFNRLVALAPVRPFQPYQARSPAPYLLCGLRLAIAFADGDILHICHPAFTLYSSENDAANETFVGEGHRMKIELTGEQLANVALSTLRAALGVERYQYLSGPITGGRRLLTWHLSEGRLFAAEGRREAYRRAVIEPNIAELREEAERQRSAGIRTIEPGSFEADFDHWGQAEFLAFWDRVLERHASSVRFIPGWQFSAGCAYEYRRAASHGLARVDLEGQEITASAAADLLADALEQIDDVHDPADPQDAALARLRGSIACQRSLLEAISRR